MDTSNENMSSASKTEIVEDNNCEKGTAHRIFPPVKLHISLSALRGKCVKKSKTLNYKENKAGKRSHKKFKCISEELEHYHKMKKQKKLDPSNKMHLQATFCKKCNMLFSKNDFEPHLLSHITTTSLSVCLHRVELQTDLNGSVETFTVLSDPSECLQNTGFHQGNGLVMKMQPTEKGNIENASFLAEISDSMNNFCKDTQNVKENIRGSSSFNLTESTVLPDSIAAPCKESIQACSDLLVLKSGYKNEAAPMEVSLCCNKDSFAVAAENQEFDNLKMGKCQSQICDENPLPIETPSPPITTLPIETSSPVICKGPVCDIDSLDNTDLTSSATNAQGSVVQRGVLPTNAKLDFKHGENCQCVNCKDAIEGNLLRESRVRLPDGFDGFVCPVCKKAFQHKPSLWRHCRNLNHGFICDVCGSGFLNKKVFMIHCALHQPRLKTASNNPVSLGQQKAENTTLQVSKAPCGFSVSREHHADIKKKANIPGVSFDRRLFGKSHSVPTSSNLPLHMHDDDVVIVDSQANSSAHSSSNKQKSQQSTILSKNSEVFSHLLPATRIKRILNNKEITVTVVRNNSYFAKSTVTSAVSRVASASHSVSRFLQPAVAIDPLTKRPVLSTQMSTSSELSVSKKPTWHHPVTSTFHQRGMPASGPASFCPNAPASFGNSRNVPCSPKSLHPAIQHHQQPVLQNTINASGVFGHCWKTPILARTVPSKTTVDGFSKSLQHTAFQSVPRFDVMGNFALHCHYCRVDFPNQVAFKEHVSRFKHPSLLFCQHCKAVFGSVIALKRHESTCTEKVCCVLCKKIINRKLFSKHITECHFLNKCSSKHVPEATCSSTSSSTSSRPLKGHEVMPSVNISWSRDSLELPTKLVPTPSTSENALPVIANVMSLSGSQWSKMIDKSPNDLNNVSRVMKSTRNIELPVELGSNQRPIVIEDDNPVFLTDPSLSEMCAYNKKAVQNVMDCSQVVASKRFSVEDAAFKINTASATTAVRATEENMSIFSSEIKKTDVKKSISGIVKAPDFDKIVKPQEDGAATASITSDIEIEKNIDKNVDGCKIIQVNSSEAKALVSVDDAVTDISCKHGKEQSSKEEGSSLMKQMSTPSTNVNSGDDKSLMSVAKDLMCPICDQVFATEKDFLKHIRIHQDITHHKCTFCSQSFLKKSHLVGHLRLHMKSCKKSSTEVSGVKCPIQNSDGSSVPASQNGMMVALLDIDKVKNCMPLLQQIGVVGLLPFKEFSDSLSSGSISSTGVPVIELPSKQI